MVALVPASWKAPETVTPEWLSTRRWASFAPGTQMHGLIAAWFGQAGFNPRPFLTLSYPGALKALATANQSAAILPLEEVDDQQRTPEVLIRPLSPPLLRPMAVAYRSSPTPNEAMTAVLEVLAEFAT
ncbi:LysR substrate binding domain protein [compost metagenome]